MHIQPCTDNVRYNVFVPLADYARGKIEKGVIIIMLSSIATRDKIQEHISEYLDMMEDGQEIIMTDGHHNEIGRFLPRGKVVSLAAERLAGILSKDIDPDKVRDKILREKYEIAD